jgi:hypothetical protein
VKQCIVRDNYEVTPGHLGRAQFKFQDSIFSNVKQCIVRDNYEVTPGHLGRIQFKFQNSIFSNT